MTPERKEQATMLSATLECVLVTSHCFILKVILHLITCFMELLQLSHSKTACIIPLKWLGMVRTSLLLLPSSTLATQKYVARSSQLSAMRGPQTHASPRKTQTPQPYVPDHTGMTDFAIYMAQRELVSSGLIKFDDKPDNYWGWKSTFTNAIYGLRPATKSLTFWRNVLSRQNRSEELELSMSVTLRLGSGWPGCVWRNAMVLLK